jgi:transposase
MAASPAHGPAVPSGSPSRLARLHRAGELTPIRVPSPAEEAVRDLVRARAALLADRKRAQQRITAMLMRHGRRRNDPRTAYDRNGDSRN